MLNLCQGICNLIEVSLLDFAKTGKLGPIYLGQSRIEVNSILGDPPLWGTQKYMSVSSIWRYGDIEIYFADEVVDMIFSDQGDFTNGGESIDIDPWIIRRGLERSYFERELASLGVSYTSEEWKIDASQAHVIVNEVSLFSFCEIPEDEWDTKGLCYWQSGRFA